MEFLPILIALRDRSLRPFQLAENIIPRTFQQIKLEINLFRSLALESLQRFFEVA